MTEVATGQRAKVLHLPTRVQERAPPKTYDLGGVL